MHLQTEAGAGRWSKQINSARKTGFGRLALVLTVVVAVLILLAVLYFQRWRFVIVDLKREVRQLQEQTDPTGAAKANPATFVQNEYTVRAEWTFAPGMTAKDYSRWLSQHVPRGYSVSQNTGSEILLRKQLADDACALQLTVGDESPTIIKASFAAGPD